jgi:hypothetical protein
MKTTKRQLRKIIREAMQLEMFDTGSAGDEVGGTSLEQKKEQCKQAGGEWISDDPGGKYGHCSKSIDEADGSTEKYDDDSALKGDQDELPDGLQKGIIDKTVEDREEADDEKKNEGMSPDDMPDAWRQILGNCLKGK